MEYKPTTEQVNQFKESIVGLNIMDWIQRKKGGIRGMLLSADNMEEVIKLQSEYKAYANFEIYIKNLGNRDAE